MLEDNTKFYKLDMWVKGALMVAFGYGVMYGMCYLLVTFAK
jgi:hypothetical protein